MLLSGKVLEANIFKHLFDLFKMVLDIGLEVIEEDDSVQHLTDPTKVILVVVNYAPQFGIGNSRSIIVHDETAISPNHNNTFHGGHSILLWLSEKSEVFLTTHFIHVQGQSEARQQILDQLLLKVL